MWKTIVFFLCPTPELTAQAAHMLHTDPNLIPPACHWTTDRQGSIEEVVHVIRMVDGTTVLIGRITMADGRVGFSAGLAPEIS